MMVMMTLMTTTNDDDDGPGFANFQRQVALATKFCTVATDICLSSIRNLLRVTILVPRNLRWFLDFWKICDPL
jgi:hypothetical protein